MMAIGAVVFALAAFQAPTSTPGIQDAVLTDKHAVFLLEPEVVVGPGVSRLRWSPDGTYLLVQRDRLTTPNPFLLLAKGQQPVMPLTGETQFLFYGAPSHRTVPSLKLPLGSHIDRVDWITGSSKALVLANVRTPNPDGTSGEPVQTLFWMSANGQSRSLFAQATAGEYFDVQVSPFRSLFLTMRTEFRPGPPPTRTQTIQFFDGEGKPMGKIPMPDMAAEYRWTPDGRVFASVGKMVNRKVVWEWYRLNPAQGTAEKLNDAPPPNAVAPKPSYANHDEEAGDLVVRVGAVPTSQAEFPPVPAVLLAYRDADSKGKAPDEKSFAYVSTDASHGALSPNGDSVAYVHKGVAMVRPLARVPKQLYTEMKQAAERTVAVSNAKQAALALMMHAGDYDDNLVASGGNWREQVMPYIKNEKILNAFTYTFAGGNMSAIEKPAETEIGYVTGPGGRAVAYADGHVKWVPDGK
jgi:prepilin-type processing-associated H-X9-DG protein